MRIIAGKAKGHTLKVAKTGVRPTSERVRESIFNRLTALDTDWQQTNVLDAFAGSGAFALESLSRGAASATAVDKDADALQTIRQNSQHTNLPIEVVSGDVTKNLRTTLSGRYSLVFVDPPYEFPNQDVTQLLLNLRQQGFLEMRGTCIVERSSRTQDFQVPDGFELVDLRDYGDTRVFWLIW